MSVPHDRSGLHLLLLAATILAASFAAAWIQTDGGRVAVRSITLPTQNGQWVAADLFRPLSATPEDPAPLVVVIPGFQRSKETLSNVSIELARRGVVVIAIDPYAQGASSASMSRRAATEEGYGMFAVVDYVHGTPNLNYVDKDRIGATGHSAGGNAAIRGASHFGRLARKQPERRSKLHSVFVSGYVLSLSEKTLRHVRSNVGASYALFDEGAYRNALKHGDMRRAPEALRLINSGLAAGEHVDAVEIGRFYGDADRRSLRVMHNERLLHPFQPYSFEAMANQLAYFDRVFGLDSGLASDAQVWHFKELLTLLSLVAAFLGILPLSRLLLRLPLFRPLVRAVPPAPPAPRGRGAAVFWTLFVVGALIAAGTFIPMAELSKLWFVDASSRRQTWFFPQRMNNAVLLWAVLNGLIGFALLLGAHLFYGRRHGATTAHWGARTRPAELLRSALFALTVFAAFFGFLALVYAWTHVDYRFVFLGVRAFQADLLPLLALYAPFLFVFFLSNSLRVNGGMRFAGVPEWRGMLLSGLGTSLGLLLIVCLQYGTFAATGTVFWTDGWLYVNLCFALVPMMFILPLFHRAFFRMTGQIYTGPMTMCAVFVMILLSNTVCYLPLPR